MSSQELIPKKLEEWTYDRIKVLVENNVNESDIHDFKTDIPDIPEGEGLTKDCCAFANTKGGFIVLGIRGKDRRFEIKGIENSSELRHRFGRKINATPTIDFGLPNIINIPASQKVLAVFYIPVSPERPHIPTPIDKRIFWKRTNTGNEQMTYDEIRMNFRNYEERREKLKLLYLELLSNKEQLEGMKVPEDSIEGSYSLVSLDSTIIDTLLSDVYSMIAKNSNLVKSLMSLRSENRVINNKIKVFYTQVALPMTNLGQITRKHNEYINGKIEELVPLFQAALANLESDFKIKNPLS
jgi:hypothetical protein